MSVAVLPISASALFSSENYLCWAPAEQQHKVIEHPPFPAADKDHDEEEEGMPGQFEIWNAIQSNKATSGAADPPPPYVHPLLRHSSSLLSQKSLEVCTESLGSETGSDDFSSIADHLDHYNSSNITVAESQEEKMELEDDDHVDSDVRPSQKGKELTSVNYQCSINRRSTPRSFPPPLPSISRRDGPCLHMKPHRRGGRLVVEAVPVPSQNYLHAQREGGRLLLSFVDATSDEPPELAPEENEEAKVEVQEETEEHELALEKIEENDLNTDEEEEEETEEEGEDEEVEVVDRGTVIEVKVSTQPQQQSSAPKVLRSSFVINKFVGDTPVATAVSTTTSEEPEHTAEKDDYNKSTHIAYSVAATKRAVPTTTTTAAAAVAAASTLGGGDADGDNYQPSDNKLLFTSKRRNREELLHNMRRCSQLRRPLFIWEQYCFATS